MPYPYERFLRFLVSRKVNPNSVMDEYDLPSVGGLWHARCCSDLARNAPSSVQQYLRSDSDKVQFREGFLEWADQEGFRILWEIQPEFGAKAAPEALDQAIALFVNPYTRAMVGMLLMAGAKNEEIIRLAENRFDLGISDATIIYYETLFWDVSLVPSKDWPGFIKTLRTEDERRLLTIGAGAPDKVEICTQTGQDPGWQPKSIYESVAKTAMENFRLLSEQANPDPKEVQKWAEMALKAAAKLESNQQREAAETADPLAAAGGFKGLFSVQVTKSHHTPLSELKGALSPTEKDD